MRGQRTMGGVRQGGKGPKCQMFDEANYGESGRNSRDFHTAHARDRAEPLLQIGVDGRNLRVFVTAIARQLSRFPHRLTDGADPGEAMEEAIDCPVSNVALVDKANAPKPSHSGGARNVREASSAR